MFPHRVCSFAIRRAQCGSCFVFASHKCHNHNDKYVIASLNRSLFDSIAPSHDRTYIIQKAKPFTESILQPSTVASTLIHLEVNGKLFSCFFFASFRVLDDRKSSHSRISSPIANYQRCTKSTQVGPYILSAYGTLFNKIHHAVYFKFSQPNQIEFLH